MDYKAIGARIKAARLRAGYTQAELAESLGVSGMSQPAIARMESGDSALTLANLVRLQEVLGQDVTHFLGFETALTEEEQVILALYRRLSEEEKEDLLVHTQLYFRRKQEKGKRPKPLEVKSKPAPIIERLPMIRDDIPPETVAKVRALVERLTPNERADVIEYLLSRRDFVEALKLGGVEVRSRQPPEKIQGASTRKGQG